jgi:hypothetical protein
VYIGTKNMLCYIYGLTLIIVIIFEQILMGEPRGAPLGSDMVVMAGNFGNINVWGDRIYNTHRTKKLKPKQRNCYFGDESPTGMGTNYYLRRNCRTSCYMFHMVKHCGCYIEAMFGLMKRKTFLIT